MIGEGEYGDYGDRYENKFFGRQRENWG